ncbi:MAG: hypothetical protein HZA51_17045 [Planctomycetes bacterium]|nr:hypothetical protein [Planctomycetota bacterium]
MRQRSNAPTMGFRSGFATIAYHTAAPATWLLTMVLAFVIGCKENARVTDSQPAKEPASTPPPVSIEQTAVKPPEPPPPPKRPKDSWLLFREAGDEKVDASIVADWTGGNRLEVKTRNVRKVVLDLTKLPEGAPTRGPWTLQIDGQGIEIFGKKGRVMDLFRSPNGDWAIVPDSHRAKP